jgi:hypothetical protein
VARAANKVIAEMQPRILIMIFSSLAIEFRFSEARRSDYFRPALEFLDGPIAVG